MTAPHLKLPSYYLVQSWEKQQVLNWLKNCQLDDCIPAFESREINGPALLELTEEKLFTFQDVKIKRRVQLTKCVNECKSQAMQAKEFVNSMRKPLQQKIKAARNLQVAADDQENDFDCWDDFDDDDEEEEEHELQHSSEIPGKSNSPRLNDPNSPEPSVHNNEVCVDPVVSSVLSSGSEQYADNIQSSSSLPAEAPDLSAQKKSQSTVTTLNKSSDKPSLPKPPSTLPSAKNFQRAHIPRSVPLKRPPSQPPPPPIPQIPRPVSVQEDYEIPINSSLVVSSVPQASLPLSSTVNKTCKFPPPCPPAKSESQETYEVVQPPEENYEVVSADSTFMLPSSFPTIRPTIPPRVNGSQIPNPPPLPEKPRKLQEVSSVSAPSSKKDYGASSEKQFSQKKIYDETLSSASNSTNSSGVLASLLSGFRDAKQGSSTSFTRSPEQYNSDSLPPSAYQSSRASTPDKNTAEVSPVGSLHSSKDKLSSTIVDGSSQSTMLSSLPIPPVFSVDDGGVLNRPLPPVPSAASRSTPLPEHAWFHDISREAAEEKLLRLSQDGAYIVRPSKRAGQENPYTLTMLHDGKIFHLNIRLRSDGMYSLGREKPREKAFPSVADLIIFHQKEPILLTSKGEPAGKAILCITAEKL